MAHHPDSRLSTTALLALLVAIFGSLCFWAVGGIAAIALAFVALSEIKRSEGRQRGEALAIASIVLGVMAVIGTAVAFTLMLRAVSSRGTAPVAVPSPAPIAAPGTPNPGAGQPTAEQPGAVTRDSATRATRFGQLTLVDPGAESGTLDTLLRDERARADVEKQTLVLWVSGPNCQPCSGVGIALADSRVQSALAGVRLLRVDAREFRIELQKRGVPIDVLPGFALLDTANRPTDYVSGGEWDADIPENIAPVLGNFIRGRYLRRRNPWRGPIRGDETAL